MNPDNNTGSNQVPHNPSQAPSVTNETIMGILAYLGILVLIPFFVAKHDPFVKFHIRQGLVLFVIEIIIYVLGWVFLPFLWSFWIIFRLADLILLILSIVGIVNVVQKKEKELPIVGGWAKHFNI